MPTDIHYNLPDFTSRFLENLTSKRRSLAEKNAPTPTTDLVVGQQQQNQTKTNDADVNNCHSTTQMVNYLSF